MGGDVKQIRDVCEVLDLLLVVMEVLVLFFSVISIFLL
jgi:hypothetical protein